MGRPILTVVIGANGAGKSTWCREHPDNLPDDFYDADSIAQGLGSADLRPSLRLRRVPRGNWPSPCRDLRDSEARVPLR